MEKQLVIAESEQGPAVYLTAVDRSGVEVEARGQPIRMTWTLLRAASQQKDVALASRYGAIQAAAREYLPTSQEQVQTIAAEVARAVAMPRVRSGLGHSERNQRRDEALRAAGFRIAETQEAIDAEIAEREREIAVDFAIADRAASGAPAHIIEYARRDQSTAIHGATKHLRERLVQLTELERQVREAQREAA